jgi:hypothetical protein
VATATVSSWAAGRSGTATIYRPGGLVSAADLRVGQPPDEPVAPARTTGV